MPGRLIGLLVILGGFGASVRAQDGEERIDLTEATVVVPRELPPLEATAVLMLREEVARRTRVSWPQGESADGNRPVVVVGTRAELASIGIREPEGPQGRGSDRPEGYQLWMDRPPGRGPRIVVQGTDSRGVLFGVGRLLRLLHMERDHITISSSVRIATAPRYPIRGHQLGYRPKTNSYDAWSVPMWEQYYRDLVVFGCNAVELIPPRSDDDSDSPHFPLPQLAMMKEMSRLADRYGLDVWIWYPALDKDYSDPNDVAFALEEWGRVFQALPRVDAVFVPGGDPGATPPKPLLALLEKQTANLRRSHPKATMWVSPQSFNREALGEFLDVVKTEPDWLGGIVFGPQNRLSLPELRKAIPERYPIRYYPDITHSRSCQYPVPDWDQAFAVTEAREVINPRPRDEAAIIRLLGPFTTGFITYSEGCNDDVNKAVWSALGWDPDASVMDVLRDYARYFIGPAHAEGFARGLLALEQNWRGPILTNAGIETTLTQFQDLERTATPGEKANWRFQQALYRAYYDAYIRRRALHERTLEDQAMSLLADAGRTGSNVALAQAEAALDRAVTKPVAGSLRARTFELAEALFQSIRMQLSVDRYQAIEVSRGASQDTIDVPLNSRPWLLDQFASIRSLPSERARLERIRSLVGRTDPGPGGFYDDLGNTARQPHLVRGASFDQDPAGLTSVLMHFDESRPGPTAWRDQALALYEQAITLRYDELDPAARYRVRAVYGSGPLRLVANESLEIHPWLDRRFEPVEFDIPPEATKSGSLKLSWTSTPGRGGNGRGCQVAEVWLLRVAP